MKYITTILKNLIPKKELKPLGKELKPVGKELKPLGRWRLENCNTQMNYKIDLSNEDHCGPCGQYILEKVNIKK
jgi:hypothetical protein